MCRECGCGLPGDTPVRVGDEAGHGHAHGHEHEHAHDHPHGHSYEHGPGHHHGHEHGHSHTHPHGHGDAHEHGPEEMESRRTVEVRRAILEKNDRLAERNRGFFRARGVMVLNVLSSPGSGKTTLLCETARALQTKLRLGVVVGDLATDNDAHRLRASGIPVVQITTGTVCHLDAEMIARALRQIDLSDLQVLVIENVGNLVCPASYDLGEDARVVLLSVTEGEDKPIKYPPVFQFADVVVISKTDLAEACGWNRELALQNIKRAAPKAAVLELSSKTGAGFDAWTDYILRVQAELAARDPIGS